MNVNHKRGAIIVKNMLLEVQKEWAGRMMQHRTARNIGKPERFLPRQTLRLSPGAAAAVEPQALQQWKWGLSGCLQQQQQQQHLRSRSFSSGKGDYQIVSNSSSSRGLGPPAVGIGGVRLAPAAAAAAVEVQALQLHPPAAG